MTDRTAMGRQLFELASAARGNSYAPYSKFKVGAAVLATSGKFFSGCNVENGAYPLSICAEQVAITKAISSGESQILAVVVVANRLAAPCGGCRQVIGEFITSDGWVLACDHSDFQNQLCWSIDELLPNRFRLTED